MSSSSTMTSDGPVCSDFSRCVGRAAQLAHCNTLASNSMRLHVSIGPSMSRVMIAEATPGPFLGADLADSSFKQCEVRGQKLLTVPCQRLAALPNHEVAAARIVVALRTPSTQLRTPCDAAAWPQSKAEQVNVHRENPIRTSHVTG